jgi:hypothetical protein
VRALFKSGAVTRTTADFVADFIISFSAQKFLPRPF